MRLTKTIIDCFNSYEGIGLFSGMARYTQLERRMRIAAAQAQGSLFRYWGVLLKKMLWPTPPKRMDAEILSLVLGGEVGDRLVLKAISTEPSSIVMLARYWHDQDKQPRKELEAEWQEVLSAGDEAGAKPGEGGGDV